MGGAGRDKEEGEEGEAYLQGKTLYHIFRVVPFDVSCLFLHEYVSTEGNRWVRGEKERHLPNRLILFVVLLASCNS